MIEIGEVDTRNAGLGNRLVEQALRGRRNHQVDDGATSGGLAEDGDISGITAEYRDVALDPLQRGDLVHEGIVAERAVGTFLRQCRVGEKAEAAQAVVDGHDYDTLLGQLGT